MSDKTKQIISELRSKMEALKRKAEAPKDQLVKFQVASSQNEEKVEEILDKNLKRMGDAFDTHAITTEKVLADQVNTNRSLFQKLVEAVQGIKIAAPNVTVQTPREISIKEPSWLKFPTFDSKAITEKIQKITDAITGWKLPKEAKDAIPVRLSDGKKFYEAITQVFGQGGGGSVPKVQSTTTPSIYGVPIVNPDGSSISAGSSGLTDAELRASAVPVSLASSPLPTGAATAAKQDTGNTSLSSIDTKLPSQGQALAAASIPVVLTAAQVSTLTPLSTVAVTQSGTWDEVGINDSGNSITVDNATISVVGSGTEATAQRVTIATDSTGVLSVDDNGGALTVDGTVAVTQSGTWDEVGINDSGNVITVDGSGSAGSAAAGVQTIQGIASMTPVQVGDNSSSLTVDYATTGSGTATGAIRVELPTNGTGVVGLNAGTNAIGKLAANSGVDIGDVDVTSIAAGDNNIGNVDIVSGTITTVSTVTALGAGTIGPMKAEDVAHASGDQGFPDWGVRVDTPNATVAANGDYHYKATDMVGGIRTALYETDFAVLGTNHVKKYYSATGATTDGIVWSPAAGKRWYITDIILTTSAAATVTFEDDLTAGDSTVLALDLAANSGLAHHFATPLFSGEDAADFLVTTTAGNIKCTVVGYEI